jgi:hypothetical protein
MAAGAATASEWFVKDTLIGPSTVCLTWMQSKYTSVNDVWVVVNDGDRFKLIRMSGA